MNSTHHFYPILIPNTSYVKKYLLHMGSQGSQKSFKKFVWYQKIMSGRVWKKIFLVKEKNLNYFCTGCPKSAVRGCKLNFWRKKTIVLSATKSRQQKLVFALSKGSRRFYVRRRGFIKTYMEKKILIPCDFEQLLTPGSFHTKCKVKMSHLFDFLQILWTASYGYKMMTCKFWKRLDHILGHFAGVTFS